MTPHEIAPPTEATTIAVTRSLRNRWVGRFALSVNLLPPHRRRLRLQRFDPLA